MVLNDMTDTTDQLVLNGQPLNKLSYNTDNFQRLKDSYEEAMDLIVKLNSKLILLTPQSAPAKADPVKNTKKVK